VFVLQRPFLWVRQKTTSQSFSCTNEGNIRGEGANDRAFMEVKRNWKNTVLAVKE
jgi:hypothetical protein